MSIHFWKYVNERYSYLNWRLCIGLWICIIIKFFTDFETWLWSLGVWYGMSFWFVHNFLNLAICIGVFIGLYAMIKINRWHKRQMVERFEERRRLEEERMERLHTEWVEREQQRLREMRRGNWET